MRNLLPKDAKRRLSHEYYMRLATVACFLLALICGMGVAALVPSYVLLNTQHRILEDQYELHNAALNESETRTAAQLLQQTESRLTFLTEHAAQPLVSRHITDVIARAPSGIRITTWFYRDTTQSERGNRTLSISGVADTREALLSFKRTLERHDDFASVALPVSNLADETNISFSVIITGAL